MYEPKKMDLVQVGRHGRPMTVITVHPVSQFAVVKANNGERHVVEWGEMTRLDWTTEALKWVDEIDAAIAASMDEEAPA